MTPLYDPTMDLLRLSGTSLSAAVDELPASLRGAGDRETADKLLRLQKTVGEQLVALAHKILDAHGWWKLTPAHVAELGDQVKADHDVGRQVAPLIPDLAVDEALGVALRVCGGCVDAAKVVRETEPFLDNKGVRIEVGRSPADRARYMVEIDSKCSADKVFGAGVSIGPLDKKLRHDQEPIFEGIAPAHLAKHFHEYRRRYPPQS